MKRLFIKICFLVPVLFMVIGVNYYGDPAQLFHESVYESEVAALLISGSPVSNVTGDGRLIQRYYVMQLERPEDTVVLGSSRVRQIRQEQFPRKTFHNYGVNGASIEDIMAISELLVDKGLKPKVVILGLDPWLLNHNNGQIRWKSLEVEYAAALRRIGLQPANGSNALLDRLGELLSPSYFQASFAALYSRNSGLSKKPTNKIDPDQTTTLPDGSILYDNNFASRTISEVQASAAAYAETQPIYSLGNFNNLDSTSIRQLELLVETLQGQGVHVIFLLIPYHPIVFARVVTSQEYAMVTKAESYFKDLASRKHIQLVGSYNPAAIPCSETEFFDGMHPKEVCVSRIFQLLDKGN